MMTPQSLRKTNKAYQLRGFLILSSALFFAGGLSAQQVNFSTSFGSNNSGYGGFTQSFNGLSGTWSENANSVQFFNDGSINNSFLNVGLLQDFSPYSTTDGTSITMTGSVLWSSYSGDNNRMGMYAFGGQADLNAAGDQEAGALSFLYNADDANLLISEGIQANGLASQGLSSTPPFTQGEAAGNIFTDYELDFEVLMEYVGTDINVTFSMTYLNDSSVFVTDSVSTTVAASVYNGNFFGFASRARDRGDAADFETGDFVAKYQDFSIEVVPEPSSFALIAGGLAGLAIFRRRRS